MTLPNELEIPGPWQDKELEDPNRKWVLDDWVRSGRFRVRVTQTGSRSPNPAKQKELRKSFFLG